MTIAEIRGILARKAGQRAFRGIALIYYRLLQQVSMNSYFTGYYFSQFLTVAFIHLLAVASPGPDFAIVVRQSVTYGRRTALFTSWGVGMGILIHVFYSLLGIGVVISQSLILFTIMKIAGAGYLMFIGCKAIRTRKVSLTFKERTEQELPSAMNAVWTGFLTNGLNPKATLFFLSLFTVIIDPGTPLAVQAFYGVYMAFATWLWFSLVSLLFGQQRVRELFGRLGHWFERLMGASLLLLGLKLAVTSQK